MKKNMIALAVAAAMVPGFAAAEGATVSGYNDITWTHDNDTNLFGAFTEVDIRNTMGDVTVGVDMEANWDQSLGFEQAFFAWNAVENVTVIAGLFNNPIGMESGDSIDKPTTKSGSIYQALDFATYLHAGNNISGLAGVYNAGVATVTVGLLNEIQQGSTADEDNSYALVVNATPVEGLDLELGYVTMDDLGAGDNALDINAQYAMGPMGFTFEILDIDAMNDPIIGLGFSYDVNEALTINAEYDMMDKDDAAGLSAADANATYGETEMRIAAWYALEENLTAGIGYNSTDTGSTDDSLIVEFLATF